MDKVSTAPFVALSQFLRIHFAASSISVCLFVLLGVGHLWTCLVHEPLLRCLFHAYVKTRWSSHRLNTALSKIFNSSFCFQLLLLKGEHLGRPLRVRSDPRKILKRGNTEARGRRRKIEEEEKEDDMRTDIYHLHQ